MISKKLLFVTGIVLFLLIVVHTLGSYLILYPMRFDFWEVVEGSKSQYLLVALAFFVLISWLISHIKIKNLNPKNRFLLVFTFLCCLMFFCISYYNLSIFFKTQKAITKSEKEYIKQAEKDIKNDSIVFKSYGLPMPMYDRETYRKIDSIRNSYGIHSKNTGCTVDYIENEGRRKYEEIVTPYLEKRNGKDWNKRMLNDIDKLKKVDIHDVKAK